MQRASNHATTTGWRRGVRGLALLLGCSLVGCVDTGARFDAYLARTKSLRAKKPDAGTMPQPTDRFDFSGRYLLALDTPIAPATPLLFRLDATVSSDLSQMDLVFQPLATDAAAQPRAPVGDEISVQAVAYGQGGDFDFQLDRVMVPGSANPISGSDIVATVELRGSALRIDGSPLLCGSALGKVTVPITLDLAGSQFGAVPADDLTSATLVVRCPEAAPDGG